MRRVAAPRLRLRWVAVGLLTAAVGLTGCGTGRADATQASVAGTARLESAPGADHGTVILSRAAASRLGIRTETVQPAPSSTGGDTAESVIPISAVLYEPDGGSWTYTAAGPLAYRRVAVSVLRVVGELVLLRSGPAVGTAVVTVGAAELLGVENGVAGE